jgi:hypothetical protein
MIEEFAEEEETNIEKLKIYQCRSPQNDILLFLF